MSDVEFTMVTTAILLYASFAYMFGAFIYTLYLIWKSVKRSKVSEEGWEKES